MMTMREADRKATPRKKKQKAFPRVADYRGDC